MSSLHEVSPKDGVAKKEEREKEQREQIMRLKMTVESLGVGLDITGIMSEIERGKEIRLAAIVDRLRKLSELILAAKHESGDEEASGEINPTASGIIMGEMTLTNHGLSAPVFNRVMAAFEEYLKKEDEKGEELADEVMELMNK